MNTTAKGNKLEDAFHEYLLDQQRQGAFVFGAHHPERCVIHRKKKYHSRDREDSVEFDVVIELFGEGRSLPHMTIVFECKNYNNGVPEVYIREFSDKLKEIFPNGAKGVLVTSSRLQRGADKVARNRNMGIVKYDEHGLEFIIDRQGHSLVENRLVQSQIFRDDDHVKSLKFSAYHDEKFFGTINHFLRAVVSGNQGDEDDGSRNSIPFIPTAVLEVKALEALDRIAYRTGPVDLHAICSVLELDLHFTDQVVQNADGSFILGSANFDRGLIQIHAHGNPNRERFTLAHEIGHFSLQHGQYLRTETIIASDLMLDGLKAGDFNYERLEYQANAYASFLLLPVQAFGVALHQARKTLDIRDRSHGYVYVDDQPVNYGLYHELLALLSQYFEASRQVIEIRLKSLGLLNDQRKPRDGMDTAQPLRSVLPNN